jgi:hypothetical protein
MQFPSDTKPWLQIAPPRTAALPVNVLLRTRSITPPKKLLIPPPSASAGLSANVVPSIRVTWPKGPGG